MIERNLWIRHIKNLRTEHDVGLSDAERIALADPQWRRWVEHRINTDNQCQRMALRHIRDRGPDSLIDYDGDRFTVR